MTVIISVTGAPRLAKTTNTFNFGTNMFKKTLVYVSRTIKTAEQTIDSVSLHIPALRNVPITPLLSNINACPKAKQVFNDAGYYAASIFCSTCPEKLQKSKNVNTPLHLTPRILRDLYNNNNICPERVIKARIEYLNQEDTRQIIVLTYARLKYRLPKFINLNKYDISVIFDEARHIPDICILKQESLNKKSTKSSHQKIKDDYVTEIKSLDFSILSQASQNNVDAARDIWCNNISTAKEFKETFAVKAALKELLGLINKKVITINAPPPPPLTFKDLKNQINFLNLLLIANGNNVALDDELTTADKDNSVSFVIRKMEPKNIESRENFKLLSDASMFTFLVDSTPYPPKYYGFWLGENYKICNIPFKSRYKFNIVIENVRRSVKNTYNDTKNTNRFVGIIKGVRDSLSILIFSSSKMESFYLKNQKIDCKYARGDEVEGVQAKEDYTLITRLPLQNINSEKYRDASIRAMTGGIGSHREYIFIKAYAELLQESFRTAKIGKTSGSFWMSMEEDPLVPKLKEYWPWLNEDINFLGLKRKWLRVSDKVDYVVQGLTQGNLGLKRSDRVISQEIIDYFANNPTAKIEDCVNALHRKKGTVRKLIRKLQVKGQIKII